MSDVLHDEWDRAYEEGSEAGRKEAWSGDYDYRTLIAETRTAALRDAVEAVKAVPHVAGCGALCPCCMDDYDCDCGRSNAIAAIERLGENP